MAGWCLIKGAIFLGEHLISYPWTSSAPAFWVLGGKSPSKASMVVPSILKKKACTATLLCSGIRQWTPGKSSRWPLSAYWAMVGNSGNRIWKNGTGDRRGLVAAPPQLSGKLRHGLCLARKRWGTEATSDLLSLRSWLGTGLDPCGAIISFIVVVSEGGIHLGDPSPTLAPLVQEYPSPT